jgi:hypothetical protein
MTLLSGTNMEIWIRVGNSISFDVELGVHQGAVVSPLLFDLALDVVFNAFV